MYFGSMVALVTPMQSTGDIDYKSLSRLVKFQLDNQSDGLVILGTTGESATVSSKEHQKIVSQVVAEVAGQVPVISGVGTNCTAITIEHAKSDTLLGVDALLIATPYYNKPTQQGLYQHYKNISEQVDNKLILYNVPGRTAVDLLPDTIVELAQIDNIIGIKETVSVARTQQLRQVVPDDFDIYCGDDENNMAMLQAGAQGLISVTANVAPLLLHQMVRAVQNNDIATADMIHQQLMLLHKNLFIESNPIPVKYAVSEMGLMNPGIRLPLTWLTVAHQPKIKAAMQAAQIGE